MEGKERPLHFCLELLPEVHFPNITHHSNSSFDQQHFNMAVEEAPRRSGRARKQVKAFAEEQAKATELAEAAQPSRGKKRKGRPVVKSGNVDAFNAHRAESQSDVDASLDQHDAPFTDDEELSPPSKKRKTSTKKKGAKNDGRQPYGAAPMGTMIEW